MPHDSSRTSAHLDASRETPSVPENRVETKPMFIYAESRLASEIVAYLPPPHLSMTESFVTLETVYLPLSGVRLGNAFAMEMAGQSCLTFFHEK